MVSVMGILFLHNFFSSGTKQNCVSEFKGVGNKHSFSLSACFLLISEKEDLLSIRNVLLSINCAAFSFHICFKFAMTALFDIKTNCV